jgi:hypothetical protein
MLKSFQTLCSVHIVLELAIIGVEENEIVVLRAGHRKEIYRRG